MTSQIRDWVLRKAKQNNPDLRGKFYPNWKGPYLVKTILTKGEIKLMDVEGNTFLEWDSVDQLRRYYI